MITPQAGDVNMKDHKAVACAAAITFTNWDPANPDLYKHIKDFATDKAIAQFEELKSKRLAEKDNEWAAIGQATSCKDGTEAGAIKDYDYKQVTSMVYYNLLPAPPTPPAEPPSALFYQVLQPNPDGSGNWQVTAMGQKR